MPTIRTIICLLAVLVLAQPALAQASDPPEDMATSGYFRDQDTLPGSARYYRQLPGGAGGLWGLGPTRSKISHASFKVDGHEGVADYSPRTRCRTCHKPQTKDLHVSRMGIACVQCHRAKPVAGVFQYYSPLNPVRRHAYVCAKCHEGATPSFASYMVHEPNPLSTAALAGFPLLFFAVWGMAILAVGVFVFFLPYTALWWFRDLIATLRGRARNG